MDEAHNCAPSGRGKYATDSLRTEAIRAPGPALRAQALPDGHAAQRLLGELHGPAGAARQPAVRPWHGHRHQGFRQPAGRGDGPPPEVRARPRTTSGTTGSPSGCWRPSRSTTRPRRSAIHAALKRYAELRQANAQDHAERFATDFVLKTLKKRLFSSPAAFLRTLEQHESSLRNAKKRKAVSKPTRGILQRQIDRVDEDYSVDDEADEATHEALDAASLPVPRADRPRSWRCSRR